MQRKTNTWCKSYWVTKYWFLFKPSSLQWYWYTRLQEISYLLLTRNIIPRWTKKYRKKYHSRKLNKNINRILWIYRMQEAKIHFYTMMPYLHTQSDRFYFDNDIWHLTFISYFVSCFAVLLNQMDHINHQVLKKEKIKKEKKNLKTIQQIVHLSKNHNL